LDSQEEAGAEEEWTEVGKKRKGRARRNKALNGLWLAEAKEDVLTESPLCEIKYSTRKDGWTRVRAIPDSGAIESVAPGDMAPEYKVLASPGSLRGQCYTSASGDEIPNEGQQVVPDVAEDGRISEHTWQLAAVTRPLKSVGQICDEGKRVIFGRSGGMIQDVYTGEVTEFTREHGIYLMDMWIPPAKEYETKKAGFAWRGMA